MKSHTSCAAETNAVSEFPEGNMRIPIFYFSGTGNTWWCARTLRDKFNAADHESRIISIEQTDAGMTAAIIKSADLVGIGYPIYGSDLPQPMKDFISWNLPDVRNGKNGNSESRSSPIPAQSGSTRKQLLVFCTQLLFSGDGAMVYRKELEQKGWEVRWAAHIRMPNNICVSALPFPYTTDWQKIGRRLRKAERKIGALSADVIRNHPRRKGATLFSRQLGLLQRAPYRSMFPRLRNDVRIDETLCIHCGCCVAACPSGNLYEEDGIIRTRGMCILCVRCYNFCPVQAVTYLGKHHKASRGIPYRGPIPDFSPEKIAAPR